MTWCVEFVVFCSQMYLCASVPHLSRYLFLSWPNLYCLLRCSAHDPISIACCLLCSWPNLYCLLFEWRKRSMFKHQLIPRFLFLSLPFTVSYLSLLSPSPMLAKPDLWAHNPNKFNPKPNHYLMSFSFRLRFNLHLEIHIHTSPLFSLPHHCSQTHHLSITVYKTKPIIPQLIFNHLLRTPTHAIFRLQNH